MSETSKQDLDIKKKKKTLEQITRIKDYVVEGERVREKWKETPHIFTNSIQKQQRISRWQRQGRTIIGGRGAWEKETQTPSELWQQLFAE